MTKKRNTNTTHKREANNKEKKDKGKKTHNARKIK
jgi:hypothetical protein